MPSSVVEPTAGSDFGLIVWNDLKEGGGLAPSSGAGRRPVAVDYADIYSHPKLGSLATTDSRDLRKSGAHWTAIWKPWLGEAPRSGYRRIGILALDARKVTTISLETFEPSYQVAQPSRGAIVNFTYCDIP